MGGYAATYSLVLRAFGARNNQLMDRRLARRNLTTGLVAAALAVMIFGATFLAAALYLD
jgi:hypothetical protein